MKDYDITAARGYLANGEIDQAMGLYEMFQAEGKFDREAGVGLKLCKFWKTAETGNAGEISLAAIDLATRVKVSKDLDFGFAAILAPMIMKILKEKIGFWKRLAMDRKSMHELAEAAREVILAALLSEDIARLPQDEQLKLCELAVQIDNFVIGTRSDAERRYGTIEKDERMSQVYEMLGRRDPRAFWNGSAMINKGAIAICIIMMLLILFSQGC